MLHKKLLLFVILFLIIIPFFWIPFGSMDLGGDASRLYFYDPASYLYNFSLFHVVPQGIGHADPNFFSIPYLLLLVLLQLIIPDPYFIISIYSAVKLCAAFLAVYLILRELLNHVKKISETSSYIASIVTGLVYVFMSTMTDNWDKALLSHDQVFVNPLSFWLLLKFLLTSKSRYLVSFLLLSFVVSHSFSYTSTPAFFAFFPLAIIFIFCFALFIAKVKIPIKGLLGGIILFIGLQAFHLFPQAMNLFDSNSYINSRVFNTQSIDQEGIRYYISLLPIAKVSNYILLAFGRDRLIMFFVPLVILLGFIFNKVNKKLLIVTSVFYIVCLLLLSANVTQVWVEVYKSFFYIPGFSMFRNFIGQWLFVYSFFYSILFGLSLYSCLYVLKNKLRYSFALILIGLIIVSGWKLVAGGSVNKVLFNGTNTRVATSFSRDFIDTISFIKVLPTSGKILTLPLTDSFYQVVPSNDYKGVYIGPSVISYISGSKDFAGYQVLGPYGNEFLRLAKEKKYDELKKLLGILGIEYIYWNSDPFILDKNYEPFLYGFVGNSLPQSQADYAEFLGKITGKKIWSKGYYHLYEVDDKYLTPHIYIPKSIQSVDEKKSDTPAGDWNGDRAFVVYVESQVCSELNGSCNAMGNNKTTLSFRRVNPTKYFVKVSNAKSPYILVMSDAYSSGWKLYRSDTAIKILGKLTKYGNGYASEFTPKNEFFPENLFETLFLSNIPEKKHIMVNGYANGWKIESSGSNDEQYFVLELVNQRIFYFSAVISGLSLIAVFIWIVLLYIRRKTIIRK
ncbi:MAG: hypothetical protein Q7T54_04260 [Candidatus Levybacteria bacterium]|nr:hypothetical protein [Candidatus Levybacteria bacterium]